VDTKETVHRFVDEAVNGGRDAVIEEFFTSEMAPPVRDWFGAFRDSFPDMHMELLELVAEGDTVVARFACSATHLGDWRGHARTARRFERVDEVYFFTFEGDRIAAVWGIEDTLDRFSSSGYRRQRARPRRRARAGTNAGRRPPSSTRAARRHRGSARSLEGSGRAV
jgi:predicted ester cyclase